MARQTAMEAEIPTGVESAVYLDARQIVNGLMGRVPEAFIGKIVGAGGAGGSLTGVPFEPAVIFCLEPTGPTGTLSVFRSDATAHVNMITLAAATLVPTVTKVGDQNWTIAAPTGLAPDGDTVTVLAFGVKNALSGL